MGDENVWNRQFSQCPIRVYTKTQLGQVVAHQLLKYHNSQQPYCGF